MRLATAAALVLLASPVLAQDHQIVGSADAVQWTAGPPSLPKQVGFAVLSGDPSKAGPFTIRLKTPANFEAPAHHHPTDEAVTVISGEFRVGMGDKLDKSKMETLRPGGFIVAPAKMNHYAFSPVETVVQVHGTGPFEIVYVDPKDDPSKR